MHFDFLIHDHAGAGKIQAQMIRHLPLFVTMVFHPLGPLLVPPAPIPHHTLAGNRGRPLLLQFWI
jgi:hypothetical protein